MVASAALLYDVLLFFMRSHNWLVRTSKAICDLFPSSVRGWNKGWPLFWSVTFGLEIPVFFACALIAGLFMALVFRSTSWRSGLLAALLAVGMVLYVTGAYLPFLIALGVLSLPVACVLLGRIRKLSNHTVQPTAVRSAASSG